MSETVLVALIGILGGSTLAALINQIFETVRERKRTFRKSWKGIRS